MTLWQMDFEKHGEKECFAYVARILPTALPVNVEGEWQYIGGTPTSSSELLKRLTYEWDLLADNAIHPYCALKGFNDKVGHQLFWLDGQTGVKHRAGHIRPLWETFGFQEIVMLFDYWFSWVGAMENNQTIITFTKNENKLWLNECPQPYSAWWRSRPVAPDGRPKYKFECFVIDDGKTFLDIQKAYEEANITDTMFYQFEPIASKTWVNDNTVGFSGEFGYLNTPE